MSFPRRPLRPSISSFNLRNSRFPRYTQGPLPSNPFYIPPPPAAAFPPISQRLRPLLPFFLYWTVLTSLAYNLLRIRTQSKADMERKDAQISVLEGLVQKLRNGEPLGEEETQRELEMVGLRDRKTPMTKVEEEMSEGGRVGWREVLLGRKRVKRTDEEQEKLAEDEWREVVHSATSHLRPPPTQPPKPATTVETPVQIKRAPSAAAYNM